MKFERIGPQKSERIRVLWVIKVLGPGGAEQLLLNAARLHDHNQFEFHCAFLLENDPSFLKDLEATGVTCHHLLRPRIKLFWPARLFMLIIKGRFLVVHSHSPLLAPVSRLSVRAIPARRRPLGITTEHNSWRSYRTSTRFLNAVTSPLEKKIFAVSQESLLSISGPARRRSELLIHGIDVGSVRNLTKERELVRQELGVSESEILIGTIANFRKHKDFPNLLAAAEQLRNMGLDFKLVVVGHGPLEERTRQIARELILLQEVIFLGKRRDAVRMISGCDIFTLASRREGLPVAIMEALALGLPIVATSVGGIREELGSSDLVRLVPPNSPHDLAHALFEVATNDHLRGLMARGSMDLAEKFDCRRMVNKLESYYQSSKTFSIQSNIQDQNRPT